MVATTKFAPMKPAPPVTSSTAGLSPIGTRQPETEQQHGEQAVLVMQRGVDYADHRRDQPSACGRPQKQPVVPVIARARPPPPQRPSPGDKHGGERRGADDAAFDQRV